jgi:hypothetical protein
MMRRVPLRLKVLGAFTALLLVGATVAAYQVSHRGAPSFRRGGQFATGDTSTTTTTSLSPSSSDTGPATSAPATTVLTPGTAASTTTRASTPTGGTPTTRSTPSTTVTTSGPATGPVLPGRPAFGTYTYAVDGEEGATFFGNRRFPDRMTTVIHGAPGLGADQVVADLRYSDSHEEREILGYRSDGVFFDFEGGSITFGPRTETSEADYVPPMLQIPKPLVAGASRSGTSQAKDASGSVTRTEDWTVRVLGQEPVTVLGATVQAWKVQLDRQTKPGSADQVTRQRVYWYDPGRALWVKFTETFHGRREMVGFTFTYDNHLTATLVGFTAS